MHGVLVTGRLAVERQLGEGPNHAADVHGRELGCSLQVRLVGRNQASRLGAERAAASNLADVRARGAMGGMQAWLRDWACAGLLGGLLLG